MDDSIRFSSVRSFTPFTTRPIEPVTIAITEKFSVFGTTCSLPCRSASGRRSTAWLRSICPSLSRERWRRLSWHCGNNGGSSSLERDGRPVDDRLAFSYVVAWGNIPRQGALESEKPIGCVHHVGGQHGIDRYQSGDPPGRVYRTARLPEAYHPRHG